MRHVLLAGLLALLLFEGADALLAREAAGRLKERLGCPARVGGVGGLFGRECVLEDVRLRPTEDTRLWIPRARLRFSEAPLWNPSAVLEEVRLEGPEFALVVGARTAPDAGAPARIRGAPDEDSGATRGPTWGPARVVVRDAIVRLRVGSEEAPLFDALLSALNLELVRGPGGGYASRALEADLASGRLAGELALEPGDRAKPRFQLRLADAEIAEFVKGGKLAGRGLSGRFSAFVEWRPGAGGPAAAGWLEARRARAWELPLFRAVLDTLDLEARPEDRFRTLRLRWHLEDERFAFEELAAVGTPVSLYGHGVMQADGSDLDVGFVPRLAPFDLTSKRRGAHPVQALLDLAQGTLLELALVGSVAAPEVRVHPLPAISAPLAAFLDALGGR